MANIGLVAVGVAALPVDRTKDGVGVIGIHKGTGAVVDGFAGDADVVGVHDPMHKAQQHPLGNERGLAFDDTVEEPEVWLGCFLQIGVVPGKGVVGQRFEGVVALHGGVLKGAHADMAGGHAGEHGAGKGPGPVPVDRFIGGDHGQATGGGHAQSVHSFANEGFAQHGAQGGQAISPAGKRGLPRALELDIDEPATGRLMFAQQQGPAIAQNGKVAKLVAGIGLGDCLVLLPGGRFAAGQHLQPSR